ncbi:hypothetical protein ACP70R_036425 [Stipagrostis hirtigluma subsp. patula]
MATKGSTRCEACDSSLGLWQATFTSECAHTFHLRCVSGSAACPVCSARWSETPAAAPAPTPTTPFSFAPTPPSSQPSPPGLFGQPAAASNLFTSAPPPFSTGPFGQTATAAANSFTSSPPSFSTGLFGQTATAAPNLFPSSRPSFAPAPASATTSTFSYSIAGARPSSPPSFGTSLFGPQPPAASNPFRLDPAQPAAQSPSCAVCRGVMGRGQATVTSECNHTFHLRCFSGSVCPVCSARWRDEVTVMPSQPFNPQPSPHQPTNLFTFAPSNPFAPTPMPPLFLSPAPSIFSQLQPSTDTRRSVFDDDEPVEPPKPGDHDDVQEAARSGVLVLKTHCEHSAIARDAAQENFAVLVHAKAPAAVEASARAPLDLVTVLDVSGSMAGSKLALLKQAMGFVIDNLGPGDRLSIVTFSCTARRIIRLTRMSDVGKASTKGAVESLFANGSTNIRDGLRVAAEVLDGRRHRNAVASIILLSDGQDNQTMGSYGPYGQYGRTSSYSELVPQSLRHSSGTRCTPVHTFGLGVDHDAAAMHAIAEVTGGTFSFIQNQEVVQDSFAQCIGGLLSVAVQESRVTVECLQPGVIVRALKSGRYESRVDAGGRAASVDVGEMYADEERRFLLFLDVPIAAGEGAEDGGVTRLIKASCTYRDAATRQSVDVASEDVVVQRPVVVEDTEPSMEVARERFRVEAAEDIAAARAAAERGQHAEAARILDRRQEASATAGLAGDARCAALVAELRELSARVADRREYEQTGRACLLAGMTSHAQQRAATVQLFGSAAPSPFGASSTPAFGTAATASGAPNPFAASSTPAFGTAAPAPSSSPFSLFTTTSMSPFRTTMPCFGQASSAAGFGAAPSFGAGYVTPTMQNMVESSRKAREQQQSATKDGQLFDPK